MNKILFGITTILLIISASCVSINVPGEDSSDTGKPTNQQPVAYIDTVDPATVVSRNPVTFNGHGTDSDGVIAGYEWRSSLDGIVSTAPSFTTSSLSTGTHTIYFRVLDNNKLWSVEVSSAVIVTPEVAEPIIESFVASPRASFVVVQPS